jgi:NAD(P)-dependent dehydrogenase (short-subunit alcohol dehydrogenase family)
MSLTVMITGANRGIGLGLTTKFLREGHRVIAAARNPDGARELWELEARYGGACRIVELDVADDASVAAAAATLRDQPIDIVINNAGVGSKPRAPFSEVQPAEVLKTLAVNALGPLRVTQLFLPHVRAGARKTVATVSSMMGSIAQNSSGGAYPYRMSKAAVNMFNRSFAVDHKDLVAVVLHPGWVQTEMGGPDAPVTVEASVDGLYDVLTGLKREHSGRFFNYTGEELPW